MAISITIFIIGSLLIILAAIMVVADMLDSYFLERHRKKFTYIDDNGKERSLLKFTVEDIREAEEYMASLYPHTKLKQDELNILSRADYYRVESVFKEIETIYTILKDRLYPIPEGVTEKELLEHSESWANWIDDSDDKDMEVYGIDYVIRQERKRLGILEENNRNTEG